MTMANTAATAQWLPQMGLPSEMPKYENRPVSYTHLDVYKRQMLVRLMVA